MRYKHLSITEREKRLVHRAKGMSLCLIAKMLGRNKSTISRELKLNAGEYSPSKAQATYRKRRKKCCPRKKLSVKDLFALVKRLFLDRHRSPEQIANHLKREDYPVTRREKIPISNELSARPVAANERTRLGDFEADTVLGQPGKACLLTLVARKSRFFISRRLAKKNSSLVA